MIELPPLLVGAVHVSETCELPAVPTTEVGAPGVVNGVTLDEAVEYEPVPAALTAATLNTCAVSAVSPVYTYDVEVEPVRICVE